MAHKRKDTFASVVSGAGWHKHLKKHKRSQNKAERSVAKKMIRAPIEHIDLLDYINEYYESRAGSNKGLSGKSFADGLIMVNP